MTSVLMLTTPQIHRALIEICNGIWAVSSFIMLLLFAWYIARRLHRPSWWKDPGIQAAGAISFLVLGHFIRAFAQWVYFIWTDPATINFWVLPWLALLPATALVLTGKMLCIWSFGPWNYRWRLVIGSLVASIGLPISLYVML